MNTQKQFKKQSAEKAHDQQHLLKIRKAIRTYDEKVAEMKQAQFIDWPAARKQAGQIKQYVLENWADLLEQFESNMKENGAEVLWAETAEQARQIFLEIADRHKAKKIVKSKSMTTEEIELNETCEANGIEVWESDLGELIVQLAGEKPYHIVTPAMHKSKAEISKLFHEKLGSVESDSAEELTMIARAHLRQAYVTADIGVSGANFLIADPGLVHITENEGNIRLTTACPPVHVVIAGIEKLLPRLEDLALFLPLLATSGTGQQLTGYNNLIRGPRAAGEADGPRKMYVILLDNGRSQLHADPKLRIALRCIRCGACLNACPVYKTIGGHSYQTTYQGPIGAVLTPQFRGIAEWHHLSDASSLCGACTQVCPVDIPLHELLLENRRQSDEQSNTSLFWKQSLKIWAVIMSDRGKLNAFHRAAANGAEAAALLLPHETGKRIPKLARQTFAQWWEENEQS